MILARAGCVPHHVEVTTGPGTINLQCTICKDWVTALFVPTDDPEQVLFVLEDQARQKLAPHEGYDRKRAEQLLAARYASAIREATGRFPPPEGDIWAWVRDVRVEVWLWNDNHHDPK